MLSTIRGEMQAMWARARAIFLRTMADPKQMPEPVPAMIRRNRTVPDALSDVWLRHWCASNEGRSFASPMLEPLPAGWFWMQDRAGWAWRIYRVPA